MAVGQTSPMSPAPATKATTPAATTKISPEIRSNYWRARSEATEAQNQVDQANEKVRTANQKIQDAVKAIQEACKDETATIGSDGEPTCEPKPVVKTPEVKK